MLVNSSLTVYHKTLDDKTRLEKWVRYNYGTEGKNTIWWFGGRGASVNKGYSEANDVQIRIPYDINENLNVENFNIGDILIQGTLENDITTQQDLSNYDVYNITSITNNTFGNSKHIHIGGK